MYAILFIINVDEAMDKIRPDCYYLSPVLSS